MTGVMKQTFAEEVADAVRYESTQQETQGHWQLARRRSLS